MKQYILLFFILVTCVFSRVSAQQLFTADDFIQWVKQFHPVARQANLQVNKAEAELTSARGGFDPTVGLNASRKTFDGKNYYYYTNPELKIPTPIGIDIKTGLENNGGNYITSEVTKGQTSYLGVEVPVGKGLLFDKRRAVLQQAKIYVNQSEQERLSMLNDLLFDAYVSYWQWAGAYQLYSMYTRYIEVAGNRLRLLRTAYNNGDKAMMDTLEAYTQIQGYRMNQTEALLKLNNASLELSNYLWLQNDSAVMLPDHFRPDTLQFASEKDVSAVEDLVSQALEKHPDLRSYQFKLDGLEVERRLKFQSLLPYINLKANLLNKDYYVLKNVSGTMLENNYKWGIELKMPLLLREGRGDYRKAKLKIQETSLQLENKRWQLSNKIRSYYNEYTLLQQQLGTTSSMYRNYQALLKNEELKFSQGESSLFVINSRESKLIELLQKQTELRVKYLKSAYAVSWAAGMLQ
ncbi:Outer membrane protein TolC [Filimonas lacunae]|uniref:Outer membrane protein TolC n=1 Tax=Filimonas lacunae TaxID=477680 RepID=A0A173MN62_9BACT|nr:TolC family protein [Filimonas lacunae]BAV08926.1 multidrug efflux protein, outer membrane component [Filimonas lacunae]SIS64118.1 Outer membrane protein TolC [Filimonas lacunae]